MKSKGFSLIELITVVFIFSLILAATFTVLTIGRKAWHTGNTQIDVQEQARNAINRMLTEIEEASSIDESTFTNDVSDDFIRFTRRGETIEFALNSAQLERTASGATTVLARDIQNIRFNLLGGNVIYVTLTTRKLTPLGQPAELVLNSQVALRN